MRLPVGSFTYGPRSGASPLSRRAGDALARFRVVLGGAVRLDLPLAVLLVLYATLWGPTLTRATQNPQMLAAFVNDEPMITLQLLGMFVRPYGDPANYLRNQDRVPAAWGTIRYSGVYYGGLYLGLGFLMFAPLKLAGASDFPLAPVVLRVISLFGGALALVVLYNLARYLAGRVAAIAAVLFLGVDISFSYYSSVIHPDTLMTALILLALWTGIRHAEQGDRASLVILAALVGLVQGTKMGAPLIAPMVVTAVALGSRAARKAFVPAHVLRRLFVVAVLAIVAFLICTPYVVLNSYYIRSWKQAYSVYRSALLTPVTPRLWLQAIWEFQGAQFCVLAVVALAAASVIAARSARMPRLALPVILCVSAVGWYVLFVRIWISVPYLLPGIAAAALSIGVVLHYALRLAISRAGVSGVGPKVVAGAGVWLVVVVVFHAGAQSSSLGERWRHYDRSTVMEVGRWAATHLPPDPVILIDDIAYFDPARFPKQVFHGGLLTYEALERVAPDYFILSGSIYDAPHYRELRKTQTYTRGHEGPYSVLLYQDLLDRGGIPEAELLTVISPQRRSDLSGSEIRLYRYRRMRSGLVAGTAR